MGQASRASVAIILNDDECTTVATEIKVECVPAVGDWIVYENGSHKVSAVVIKRVFFINPSGIEIIELHVEE